MASIGLLQIDFVANLAKFTTGVATAGSLVERFASRAAGAMDRVEKSLERPGIKLTAKLTAPLAALSIASIKAADTNKTFADSMERLALQTQKALAPLGGALIQAFETLRPAVEDGVRFVNGLAQAFAELEPAAKNQVILIGAIAAGIGPALVAFSAIFTIMKAGFTVVTALAGAFQRLGLVIPLAFEFGKYIGNFEVVQRFVAQLITAFERAGSFIEYLVTATKEGIQTITSAVIGGVATIVQGVTSRVLALVGVVKNNAGAIAGLLTGLGVAPGLATAGINGLGQFESQLQAVSAQASNAIDASAAAVQASAARGNDAWEEMLSQFIEQEQALQITMDRIAADAAKGRPSFAQILADDLGVATDKLQELGVHIPGIEELNKLLARGRELAAGVKLPEVVTKKDLENIERFNAALDRQIAKLAEVRELASKIAGELDPRRAIRDRAIAATQNFFDGGIDADQLKAYLTRLQKEMDEVVDDTLVTKVSASIRGFSDQVSGAFADLVVDGKAAANELIRAFAKLQVSLIANEAIFKPLASAIGTGITSYFGGGAKASASATTPVAKAADGIRVSGPVLDEISRSGGFPKSPIPRGAGAGTVVNIIDQRSSGQKPEVVESTGPDGRKQITVLIRDTVGAGIASGAFDKALGASFGLSRRAAAR